MSEIPLPGFAAQFRPRWPGDEGGFIAEQMRAYGAACAAAERSIATDLLMALQSIVAIDDGDRSELWPFAESFDAGRAAIVAAIRARGET